MSVHLINLQIFCSPRLLGTPSETTWPGVTELPEYKVYECYCFCVFKAANITVMLKIHALSNHLPSPLSTRKEDVDD